MHRLARKIRRRQRAESQPAEPTFDEVVDMCQQLTATLNATLDELEELRAVRTASLAMMELFFLRDPNKDNDAAVGIHANGDATLAYCLSEAITNLRDSLNLSPREFGPSIERTVH